MRRIFTTPDEDTARQQEIELGQLGYELSENLELGPGQYSHRVDVDLNESQPVFTVEWEERE